LVAIATVISHHTALRSNNRTPRRCRGSPSGASRTRTGDLLGAIQALASPEFGLFAGVSRRSRLGLRPGFSASFRSFTLGSGQRTRSLARSAIDRPTAGVFTIGSERRTVSRAGTHLLIVRSERLVGGEAGCRSRTRSGRRVLLSAQGREVFDGGQMRDAWCKRVCRRSTSPAVGQQGGRTTTHAPLRRLTRRASAR
jgi:hypothetical protein